MAGSGGYLKSTARKSPFVVIYSSGSEDDYSAKELEACSPYTRGWRSSRFCLYPQEIVLQLEQTVRVRMIQLLSHHTMVPTKIEFFTGTKYRPTHHSTFTRLGYVSFSDNKATGYKKRELKSVYVDCHGTFIKLVLHSNHINKLNLYNQIGLVAVNVLADWPKAALARKLQYSDSEETELISLSHPQELDTGLDTMDNALEGLLNKPASISHTDDISFAMTHDPVTADLIKKLDSRKKIAVQAEDYEEAKHMKHIVDELSKASEFLCRYEVAKREAVSREDYDAAKLIKAKMDHARDSLYDRLGISKVINTIFHKPPVDNSIRESLDSKDFLTKKSSDYEHPPAPPVSMELISRQPSFTNLIIPETPACSFTRLQVESGLLEKKRSSDQEIVGVSVTGKGEHPNQVPLNAARFNDDESPVASHRGSNYEAVEERQMIFTPIMGKHESLEIRVASEVFGRDTVSLLYSKHHTDKRRVIVSVLDSLHSICKASKLVPSLPKEHNVSKIVHAASQVIAKGLQEKVFTIFSSSQKLLNYLVGEFATTHKLSNTDYAVIVDNVLPILLAVTGDINSRLSTAAIEIITDLSRHEKIKTLRLIGPMLIEPFKTASVSSNQVIGRLVLLQKFVADPGIPSSDLTIDNIVKYALQYMNHSTAQVREESVNLLIQLYEINDIKVKSLLPIGYGTLAQRKMIWKNLLERFDRVDELRTDRKEADVKPLPKYSSVPDHLQKETSNTISFPSSRSYVKHKLDKTCVFCGMEKEEFLEQATLEEHYSKGCPMLHSCSHCGQVIEISSFKNHLLQNCTSHQKFIECSSCKEAVSRDHFREHIEGGCLSPPPEGADRCPLCHKCIPNENGWKKHLMGDQDNPGTCEKSKLKDTRHHQM